MMIMVISDCGDHGNLGDHVNLGDHGYDSNNQR